MLAKLISAQGNLVPNPSFELNIACPTSFGQVYKLASWSNPTGGSPEYYDSCGTGGVGVPTNWFGSQIPFEGSGYVGIAGGFGNYYEYVQAHLNDSLHAGVVYCVSFYISLADRSAYTTLSPQVYFSQDSINSATFQCLNYVAQVMDTNMIYDTTGWVQISGLYTANGGEKYMTLGSFIDSANTQFDTVRTDINAEGVWYFYVDVVEVYEQVNANASNDGVICNGDSSQLGSVGKTGILYRWNTSFQLSDSTVAQPWVHPEQTTTYYLTIADTGSLYCLGTAVDSVTITVDDCPPNTPLNVPTILRNDDIFYIASLPENSTLELFDNRGRLIFREKNYQNSFSVINLAAGIYLYQLKLSDQTTQTGKFCVVK